MFKVIEYTSVLIEFTGKNYSRFAPVPCVSV